MGTSLYDKAIVEKLGKWTEGTQVTIVPPDESRRLWEIVADKNNDNPIKLPFITLRKSLSFSTDLIAGKSPMTYNGFTTEANVGRSTKLNVIPIMLSYQIDVYARYYEEADEYTRNLLFNLINYPVITIQIPYEGKGYTHNASMRIVQTIDDNSSSQERLLFGQFTRMSIGIEVTDAHLFDVRTKDNISIGFKTYTIDPDGKNDFKINKQENN